MRRLKKKQKRKRRRKNKMASKGRACKICKNIYEGDKCPECSSQEYVEEYKGRVMVFDAENSEIAKKMNIRKKGLFAIKTR